MARFYRVDLRVRLINRLMTALIRWGIAPKQMHLLIVTGRKTGRLYATPVSIVEFQRQRWLVSPYGEVHWVRNVRASGQVTLQRGRQTERVGLLPADIKTAAAVLKQYLQLEPITQPYFEAEADAPLSIFEAEAHHHPVFQIVTKPKEIEPLKE